jgi:hypothetical protein
MGGLDLTYGGKLFRYYLYKQLVEKDLNPICGYVEPENLQRFTVFIPSFPRTVIQMFDSRTPRAEIQEEIKTILDRNSNARTFDLSVFVVLDTHGNTPDDFGKETGLKSIIHNVQGSEQSYDREAKTLASDIHRFRLRNGSMKPIPVGSCIPAPGGFEHQDLDGDEVVVSFNLENGINTVYHGFSHVENAKNQGDDVIHAHVISTSFSEHWNPTPPRKPQAQQVKRWAQQRNYGHAEMARMSNMMSETYGQTDWVGRDSPSSDHDEPASSLDQLRTDLESMISTIFTKDVQKVVFQEYDVLRREYSEQHFTSCGLRVGRLLELVIYAMGKNWEVSLEKEQFTHFIKIRDQLNKLEKIHLKYYHTKDSNERNRQLENLKKNIIEINKLVTNASIASVTETMELNTKVEYKWARNIIEEIYAKFSHIPEVRAAFGTKGVERIVEVYNSIIEIRNQAAHASIELEQRELGNEEVDEMINIIRKMMIQLTNIGIAIDSV